MIKKYCDICTKEIENNKFQCEFLIAEIREVSQMIGKQITIQPEMRKNNYHLCRDCLKDKLPEFLK